MLSFLRDTIWQSISGLIALIALGVSIFLYFAQKNRKSLSCRLLAETKLFRHVNGKFQTTYDGRPVQNVFLIIIKVLNDGNTPILASDFAQELTFSLGSNVQVLSAEPIHASPEDLKPTLHTTQSTVTVQPLLLNSKDEIDIQILCDGYQRNIKIESRIVGVREVRFFKSSTQYDESLRWLPVTILAVLTSAVASLLPLFMTANVEFRNPWFILMIAGIVFVTIIIIFTDYKRIFQKYKRRM